MVYEGNERRQEQRISLECLATVKSDKRAEAYSSYIHNISSGGSQVFSNIDVSIEEKITVRFTFLYTEFVIEAVVVNVKDIEESRKRIFRIAKNLDFQKVINIKFINRISADLYSVLLEGYKK
jgi:hypothetical protein